MTTVLRHAIGRFAVRGFVESVLLLGAILVIAYGVPSAPVWDTVEEERLPKLLLLGLVCHLSLYSGDFYRNHLVVDRLRLCVRVLGALGAALWILTVTYFWSPKWFLGWRISLVTCVVVFTLAVAWRLTFAWLCRGVAHRERLLLVGTGQRTIDMARELFDRRRETGLDIVGFVDASPDRVGMPIINPGVVGTVEDIPRLAEELAVDRVVVSLSEERGTLPMDKLLTMRFDGVAVDHLPSVYEEYAGKIAIGGLRPSWLIFSPGFQNARSSIALKRALDVIAACFSFVVFSPLMLLAVLLVKFTSRGPVLYHQERVGLQGRVFRLHKFRSMHVDAEAKTGPVWAQPGDERVTVIGRFLRSTRFDELPQFWNILVGEMSLVGPRPERPDFIRELTRQIPFYGRRHAVKPGLTGWAQVRYPYGASVEDAAEKLKYDLFYIKNRSVGLDIFILLATVKTVLLSRGW
jgi:sugar transferase (PEP-CTERM system associated)